MQDKNELRFGSWWKQGKEPIPTFSRKHVRYLAAVLHQLYKRQLMKEETIELIADSLIGIGKHYDAIRFVQWATKGDLTHESSTGKE